MKHFTNAGGKPSERGHCKDCTRSRVDAGGQRYCAIKEQFTSKISPVKPDFSCVAWKGK